MPEQVLAEVERVGETVRCHLPALGEVWQRCAVALDAGQAAEQQRGHVAVDVVRAREERGGALGVPDDSLDITRPRWIGLGAAEGVPASEDGEAT